MNKHLRIILDHAAQSSDARVREAALRLAPRRRTPKQRPESVETKERQQAEREEARENLTLFVRATVWALSDGRCEACLKILPDAYGDLDHWRGGRHRKDSTRIMGTWRLCRECHREKHDRCHSTQPQWREKWTAAKERRVARLDFAAWADLFAKEDRLVAAARTEKESAR